ncbi:MAG: AbrB/MazE/SpoVT family DNA-binding domain-containing protein, partial [Opitutales bacterium]
MIRVQAKITAKGQVTLPKGLRTALALQEGDHIQFTLNEEGGALLEKRTVPGSSAGCGARLAAARKAP